MLKAIKIILLLLAASLLSSCLGGSVAMQIARSVATSVADNAVANAMDVQDGPSNRSQKNSALKETEPDEFWMAMATSGFRTVEQNNALGAEPVAAAPPEEAPQPQILQANTLVRVQLFNLLIGNEKEAVYEKARLVGALNLPNKREWMRWHVATGMTQNDQKVITFLIPPEFGKLPSGALAVVELASPGDLNIARYKLN